MPSFLIAARTDRETHSAEPDWWEAARRRHPGARSGIDQSEDARAIVTPQLRYVAAAGGLLKESPGAVAIG
jgi:hypothetical protein